MQSVKELMQLRRKLLHVDVPTTVIKVWAKGAKSAPRDAE